MDELINMLEDNRFWEIQNEYNHYSEKYKPVYNSKTNSFSKLENKHIFVNVDNGIKSLIIDMEYINPDDLDENTLSTIKEIHIDLPDDINILVIENILNNKINFNLNLDKLVILEIINTKDIADDFIIDKINVFPPNLKHLTIGTNYNNHLDNLPCGLISLKIGEHFNKPLDNLPLNLQILEFDRYTYFNQPLDYLPHGMRILKFDRYSTFNQPLDNLPSTLEILSFHLDSEFNQPLVNIPNNLKIFIGGNAFMHYKSINNFQYNKYIERIDISYQFSTIDEINELQIPKSCKYFRIWLKYNLERNNLINYIKQKYPDIEFDFI